MKSFVKANLTIPVALSLFLANTQVQADETTTVKQETSLASPVSSESTSTESPSATPETSQVSTEAITASPEATQSAPTSTSTESTEVETKAEVSTEAQTTVTSEAKESETPKTREASTERVTPKALKAPKVVETSPLSATPNAQDMTVTYTGEVPKNSEVRVAVWSQIGGQDDLKWYTLQNGQTTVPYNNHWEYGLYHLHAYLRDKATGKMTFAKSETITLAQPALKTTITATSQTSFEVTVSNVPAYFHKLYIPIWSATNGQDDLKWYEGQKQSNGTYKVSVDIDNHKSSTGLYHIHYYEGKPNGKKAYVGQASYNQPVPKAPALSVKVLNDRSFEVTITNVPAKYSKVLLPTWTSKNGQDDLKWYQAQKQSNGSYKVTVALEHHKFETENYQLHLYGEVAGKKTFLAGRTHSQPKMTVQTTVSKVTDGQFTVSVTNVPSYIDQVRIPTWTDKNGQDDIKWYVATKQADGTYSLTVNIKDHKYETGLYHIHVYGNAGQVKNIFLNANRTYQVPSLNVQTTVSKVTDGQFTVSVTNVPSYIDQVRIPTWTDKNGQDDIKWYVATKQADGTYSLTVNIKDHKYETGLYHIHVYGNAGQVKNIFLNANRTYQVPSLNVQTTVSKVTDDQFTVSVTNVPSYIDQVRIPTWTDKNGQDDIKWYVATKQTDGTYSLTVNIKDHKYETGLYHIHVYGNAGQVKNIFLNANKTYQVPAPKVDSQIESLSETSFKVTVRGVPSYLTSLTIPTWSSKGGQDDIKWYQATKQSDGTYSLTVNIKDHKYETGLYHIHTYGRAADGKLVFLKGDQTTVKELPKPTATLTIKNVNNQTGTFDVIVSDLKSIAGVTLVQLPTWSESKGQDDLKWYQPTKQADGTYKLTVRASNHKYTNGKYHVHLYVTDKRNTRTFVAAQTVEQTGANYFVDISSHNGSISVSEFQGLKRQGILGVVVKLTEGTTYTNPFAQGQIINARAAGLKVSSYHYSHYTSQDDARAEAQHFTKTARAFGLSGKTVMINDIEETKMQRNLNTNTQAWLEEMKKAGFVDNMYYTGANWLDIRGGVFNTSQFGPQNIWVAHYTKGYTYMTQSEAKELSHYKEFGAWQYTSVSTKLPKNYLDENIDYTGRLTV
ncbi:GBS Bsp-like repeat-containing protein [Streptococcus porci]